MGARLRIVFRVMVGATAGVALLAALSVWPQRGGAQSASALIGRLDGVQPIAAYIAPVGAGGRPGDRQLAAWALAAWSQAAGGGLQFRFTDEQRARVRLYWVTEEDGLYGEMRPIIVTDPAAEQAAGRANGESAAKGQRGAAVFVRPEIAGLGEEMEQRAARDPLFRDTIVYLTCLHELGHAMGLEHTAGFADIMYFFGYGGDIGRYFGRYRERLTLRDDIAKNSGLSPADISRIRALYPAGVASSPASSPAAAPVSSRASLNNLR
jgi:hypothetical protein